MNNLLNKLRSLFLSPNSSFELSLRTAYHKLAATRLFFHLQNSLARRSYRKYRSIQKQNPPPGIDSYPYQPKITFLISFTDGALDDLQSTVLSILELQGDRWEAILVSPRNDTKTAIDAFNDPRITHIQPDHPNLPGIFTGEFVVFCQSGDQFVDTLLNHFYESLSDQQLSDLTSFDCEYIDEKTGKILPFFKPTVASPALLLSVNYLSRSFIHIEALQQVWSQMGHNVGLLCLEYDLIIRLCEAGKEFRHIPAVLLMQNRLVKPDTPEMQAVLKAHLSRQGLMEVAHSQHEAGVRFSWKTGSPSLAIIILSKNNYRFLKPLVPALLAQPYEGHRSIHIVDNGSDDPATIAFYQEIQPEEGISIIPYPQPFNYSEAINLGVNESNSDLLLLLNDDIALINDLWLGELTQWAVRPDVGVVGAKLLRKNRTVQHAGIILGLTGFMGHIYLNAPEHYNGMLGSVDWLRNYLAMTGACQMVRREVFNEVGGYDEGYQLAFGDIDFCLKVYEQGYQNVYTPFAQLYHFEGSSRGYITPVGDVLRGYEQLEAYLVEQDPYFNPNLTYTRIPKCMPVKQTTHERQGQIEARKRFYLKSK